MIVRVLQSSFSNAYAVNCYRRGRTRLIRVGQHICPDKKTAESLKRKIVKSSATRYP